MKRFVFMLVLVVLIYTRFTNIGWGLPYPMHPDERNMANAVQGLNCNLKLQISNFKLNECLNPHFFAYGQFPLYVAYGGVQIYHFVFGLIGQPTYEEATISLRVLSAAASLLLVYILLRIIELLRGRKPIGFTVKIVTLLFFIFSPYAIQFAHFGTTESLLMLLYACIVYVSLLLLSTKDRGLLRKYILFLGVFSGLAMGTKLSSILFLGIPALAILLKIMGEQYKDVPIWRSIGKKILHFIGYVFIYLFICTVIFLLASPHNILNWNDFISSMNYESAVGLGAIVPFYTRQFIQTLPIIFQMTKILPYALGWPTLVGGILGFFILPSKLGTFLRKVTVVGGLPTRADSRHTTREHWRDGKQLAESSAFFDILRFSLLLSFLPPSFFFAKWTRFIAPTFPLFSLFAVMFIIDIYQKLGKNSTSRIIFFIVLAISLLPGIATISIYTTQDVRFTASEWIYKNIRSGSTILSETANAVDLPILSPTTKHEFLEKNFYVNSFNFYDLDQNVVLQNDLNRALRQSDYVIIPTRRIFYNHTCFDPDAAQLTAWQLDKCAELQKKYPQLNSYYRNLFSGEYGFQKVAEFSSFPKISFMGVTLFEFPDETAEETWTVFDHPVIRIYKKNSGDLVQSPQLENPDMLNFSTYKTTDFQVSSSKFKLLVADTEEKWTKGLMYVKDREDIGGADGMIFIFPETQPRTFWNKNTFVPLTLYWIQNMKVIGSSNLPSVTETGVVATVSSPSSADTVIEIIK